MLEQYVVLCNNPSHEPVLRDAFPNMGLFAAIRAICPMPWADDTYVTDDLLDLEYFGNHSGGKFCSPLVKLLLNEDDELTAANIAKLAGIIVAKYRIPWFRLWATFDTSYDPIENYNMQERTTRQRANSESEQVTEDKSKTGTLETAYGKKNTIDDDSSSSETDSVFGFNSGEDANPADTSSSSSSRDATETLSGKDTDTYDLVDSTEGRKDKIAAEDEVEDHTRHGNIGVTTNQAMIESERKVLRWNYFEHVFRDLDYELTLALYDPCRV